jgi:hypothetical protein
LHNILFGTFFEIDRANIVNKQTIYILWEKLLVLT